LTVIIAVIAGISGLFYASTYSPLLFGGAIAAVAFLAVWFQKPAMALYVTLFIVLTPVGILPLQLHSNLNRSMTILTLGIWVFDVIFRRRRIVWTSTTGMMLGFLTWSIVTLFWATNIERGTTGVQGYALRFLLYLLLIPNLIKTKKDLDGLMITLAISGWTFVLFSFSIFLHEGFNPGSRFQVMSANENAVGTFVMITLLGVLWQAMRSYQQQKLRQKITIYTFIILSIAFIALSGSRGSALSMLITLFFFLLWKPTRVWGRAGLIILALAVIFTPILFTTTLNRFDFNSLGTLLGGREALWQAGVQLIRDNYWLGVGIGNSGQEVLPYLRMIIGSGERAYESLHNPVLVVWAETGILGLLLYLGILVTAILLFVRQYGSYKNMNCHLLTPYFALVSSIFIGYMSSWIKGGAAQASGEYFLLLAFLIIPSCLDKLGLMGSTEIDSQISSSGKPRMENQLSRM
jgi:O-antigen ligase